MAAGAPEYGEGPDDCDFGTIVESLTRTPGARDRNVDGLMTT